MARTPCPKDMKGEVVSLHLFDVGGTLDVGALAKALDARTPTRGPSIGKGTPAYVEFPQPVVLQLPPIHVEAAFGRLRADVFLAFFPLGAVSVRLRIPIEIGAVARLTDWSKSTVDMDGKRMPFDAAARALVERERAMWGPCVRGRYTDNILGESYTIFAFHDVGENAEAFLQRHTRDVAGLLTGEDGSRLHDREVKEALEHWFSYYTDDVVVVDWDAAFIIDPDADYEDLLFTLEIANLQLLEFRAYDDHLDDLIERAYDELQKLFRRPALFRNVRRTVHELSLMRIEVAELADEADNVTKFLGDWYLARVYEATQDRFHLKAWRDTVDEKLASINKLYTLANDEGDSLRMLTLELLIVLLFILDLAVLLWPK